MDGIGHSSDVSQVAPQARAVVRQVVIDMSIMTIIGVVMALLGPFGTFAQPLAIRLAYWIGMAWAGYVCFRPLGGIVLRAGAKLDLPEWGLWLAACVIASVPMAAIVWSLPYLGRPFQWPSAEGALVTYLSVLLLGGTVTVLFNLLERRKAAPAAETRPQSMAVPPPIAPAAPARFLDRLPPELGSQLVALEMEDHYVRAHTTLGSDLVLMRMRDAVAELGELEGLQVHRSWWVARGAVEQVQREGRNVRLFLAGGIAAPVARANVALLKERGWI
jgi:hypothetical protein